MEHMRNSEEEPNGFDPIAVCHHFNDICNAVGKDFFEWLDKRFPNEVAEEIKEELRKSLPYLP